MRYTFDVDGEFRIHGIGGCSLNLLVFRRNRPNSGRAQCVSESRAMRSDSDTTVQYLRELLIKFRDDRDWEQFHDPKSLAEAISIEASELLELFLWKSAADVKGALKSQPRFRKAVEEELADVFCFGLNLANVVNIDVASAIIKKIETNKKKYPIMKSKGTATKYDKL